MSAVVTNRVQDCSERKVCLAFQCPVLLKEVPSVPISSSTVST